VASSFAHIDPSGQVDLEPAPESRIYHFAGTQHGAGTLPPATGSGPDGSTGRYPYNVVDYRPLLRAALINLDRWVSDGVEPPLSCHPRLDDGTAVTRAEVLAAFGALPDIVTLDPERLWTVRALDLGPDAHRGVGRYPAQEGQAYPSYAAAVDRVPPPSIATATRWPASGCQTWWCRWVRTPAGIHEPLKPGRRNR
jgi:hypothetical protein